MVSLLLVALLLALSVASLDAASVDPRSHSQEESWRPTIIDATLGRQDDATTAWQPQARSLPTRRSSRSSGDAHALPRVFVETHGGAAVSTWDAPADGPDDDDDGSADGYDTRPATPAPAAKPVAPAAKPAGKPAAGKDAADKTAATSDDTSVGCTRPVEAQPLTIEIDEDIIALGKNYTFPPFRGTCATGKLINHKLHNHAMPAEDVEKILHAVWSAFGAEDPDLSTFVAANMKQAQRESSLCPNVLQGHIGDVNDNNPAGGLFQFIQQTYLVFAVDGFEVNRFNPLSNMLATVNAQVNSKCITTNCGSRILNGCSGWNPHPGTNPYAIPKPKVCGKSSVAGVCQATTDTCATKIVRGKCPGAAVCCPSP